MARMISYEPDVAKKMFNDWFESVRHDESGEILLALADRVEREPSECAAVLRGLAKVAKDDLKKP